jgi:hypothetical protein
MQSAPKKVLLPTELKKRNSVGPPHDSGSDGSPPPTGGRERSRSK